MYHKNPHHALPNEKSPLMAFRDDPTPLRFVDETELTKAFYHIQTRKVTKVGCISFNGVEYEVGTSYIGMKVNVIYDSLDLSSLIIEVDGWEPFTVFPLQIGTKAGQRSKLAETKQLAESESSRLLDALASDEKVSPPVASYRNYREGGRN